MNHEITFDDGPDILTDFDYKSDFAKKYRGAIGNKTLAHLAQGHRKHPDWSWADKSAAMPLALTAAVRELASKPEARKLDGCPTPETANEDMARAVAFAQSYERKTGRSISPARVGRHAEIAMASQVAEMLGDDDDDSGEGGGCGGVCGYVEKAKGALDMLQYGRILGNFPTRKSRSSARDRQLVR